MTLPDVGVGAAGRTTGTGNSRPTPIVDSRKVLMGFTRVSRARPASRPPVKT
jgi:hypothetical protein